MKPHTMSRIIARFTWDRLKVSFWFTPLIMSLGAILLARAMNWVDMRLPNALIQNNRLILSANPVELRTMLITMATNVIGTAGVVFSLLHLPLSTVANQYGSRILRVFQADRTTQFVLGMYAGTFVYCITAATLISRAEVEHSGSQVMVSIGILLMMATTTSLIVLIQHISTMLQAPNIAAAVGAELREVVRETVRAETRGDIFRENGQHSIRGGPDTLVETAGYPVRVKHTGYVKTIDVGYLLVLSRQKDLIVRLLCKPGQFVWRGEAAALVWPSGQVDERTDRQVQRAFRMGNQRTPTQDIEYAVEQLVEIAVRAMSSGSRDPFTAMTCLDHLGESLAHYARQGDMTPNIYDRDGRLRFIFEPLTFAELLNSAFDMLRHISRDNAPVLLHMLKVIAAIGQEAKSPAAQQELLRHVGLIQAESQKGALIEQDRQLIHQRCDALQTIFAETSFAQAP